MEGEGVAPFVMHRTLAHRHDATRSARVMPHRQRAPRVASRIGGSGRACLPPRACPAVALAKAEGPACTRSLISDPCSLLCRGEDEMHLLSVTPRGSVVRYVAAAGRRRVRGE